MSPQFPVAADQGGGQTGAVGPGDAQPLQVHADQLGGPHPGGQAGGHIVRVASVHVFDPVDVPGLDGGEAGRRGQQVIRSPALGDLLQGQLVGAQAPLFHRHQSEPDGGGPQLFFVQHPPHDVLQRGDVHAALGHELAHRLAQALQTRAGGGQLHHILAADAQPHIPGRLILPQDVHGTVQTADAGAGDHTGLPAQLVQGAPDPYHAALDCAATGQHQPPAKFFCAHPASLLWAVRSERSYSVYHKTRTISASRATRRIYKFTREFLPQSPI